MKKEIKLSEVKKIIAEEYATMKKKMAIQSRIGQINEELQKMEEEEKLDEVKVDGEMKTSSETGLEPGVQYKPKFEKKGSHLLEDEMEEMGEFESKFAEIGKAIDMKLSGEAGEEGGEDFDAVTIEDKPEGEEVSSDDAVIVGDDDEKEDAEEVDEYREIVGGVGAEQGMTADQAVKKDGENKEEGEMKESVDEPIEGKSVAQEVSADTVNDNMEKDTHVKESVQAKDKKVIAESKEVKKGILSEGMEAKKAQALNEELNRMKRLAKLSDDEE